MKRFVWGIVIGYLALLLWGANYLVVVKGYDSYAYGRIYSSDSSRKRTQIALSLVDEAHRLKHEEHWTDERIDSLMDQLEAKYYVEDEGIVIVPWIYYPRKWKIERIVEQYGKDSRLWPEEVRKEILK